ncbi:aldehyde dehydrogenase family protein [Natrinema sp. DC36]|uniref:aldehyde dehydrogenase family protein n=1 Tax=Natrinema sp. DC36 TaxID=2878680 RepID=UPI001CF0D3DE|nr:aldehyde dehydrogenase family protein [Natrinema sp. DC36]
MAVEQRNYVDGEWIESETGDTITVENPAAPDEVVARYQQSSAADAERAIEAAAAAADEWGATPGPERGRILAETGRILADRKDELTELLVREEGKTRGEAAGEVQRAIDIFRYYGSKTHDLGGTVKSPSSRDTTLYTVKEPLGVVGLITPWNYPIAIPAWKLAPALAAGNAAVLKPASIAPGVAHAIFEALDEAGLPDGVANFVTGPGSSVGGELVTSDSVDAISFTGSTAVGTSVYDQATEDGKRVQLEMGGKNPTIVSDSADVEEAADIVAAGAFGVTGQACTACSRAIVHTDVYDEFVEAVVDRAAAIEPGPGLEESDMGPHVSESELEGTLEYVDIAREEGATLEYVDIAREEGATLETGGSALDRDGYYVEPTVFSDVEPSMRLAQEEVFGPVLAVLEVEDFDDALAVANGVDYGLSASVVTDDHTEANRFVDEIEAGVAKVNAKTTGLELHVPFGGMKDSSSETWREQGDEGLEFYTIEKTVYDNY